ncbi:MAG TPA: hypothetical protein VFR37_13635 [Longimicrobium sp.]|nr:hypothetical protein [Longimicrobium sp.]
MPQHPVRTAACCLAIALASACARDGGGAPANAAGKSAAQPPAPAAPALPAALASLCGSPGAPSTSSGRLAGFTRHELSAGDHLLPAGSSQIDQPVRCVARTQAQLAALSEAAHRGLSSPPPSLDGAMVVLAGMGEQAATGHDIAIDSVLVRADTALVFVTERFPGSSCTEGMLVYNPADAVRMPAAAVVRFHERRFVGPPCVTGEESAGAP